MRLFRIKALFAVLALFPVRNALAGIVLQENTITSNTVTAMPSATISVQDDQFGSLPATPGFINQRVTNKVMLYVDHTWPVFVANAYTYTVKLKIITTDANLNVSSPQYRFLTIQYDPNASPGSSYRDKIAYSFTGAHKIEVNIEEIKDGNGNNVVNPEDNFVVKSSIEIERYYNFNAATTLCVCKSAADLNADGTDDELTLSWNSIGGAEHYDLEWTYVDDYDATLTTPKSISQIKWNFRQNSTRISTAQNSYKINLIYERGYIIYRVRGVGRVLTSPDNHVPGAWSLAEEGTDPSSVSCSCPPANVSPYYYVSANHRASLNWQYSSVYAEEGKKKEVASYYDGSLRGRQTVTKINSDNTAVAAESIYDFNGRKAIDILPVPLQSPALDYNTNLNVNSAGNKYTWKDFDTDNNACTSPTGALGNQNGAGRYYSPSNPDKTGMNAYIANAGGFPFSQVEYTPDNTGRIRRQGGVGEHHQLGYNSGSGAHDTRYYYGQPMQVELDRLFGNEVGFARHYKKNMVLDPNGQLSISYLDQEGRVIATALTGALPGNVSALESRPANAVNITADMFAKNAEGKSLQNLVDMGGTALIYNATLLVSEPGNHVFSYGVTPMQYTPECAQNICFDCIYDLELSVRDECGQLLPGMPKKVRIGHPVLDNECGTVYFSEPLNPFTLNLAVGNYQVSKVLSVNQEAYEHYLTEFLKESANTCITPMADLIQEEKAKLDYESCEITCQQCAEALGTRDEYVLAGRGTEEQWEEEYRQCWAPCKAVDPCESGYIMLMSDMTPGGQYGEYLDKLTGQTNTYKFPLSIFNSRNELPDAGLDSTNSSAAWWRHPKLETASGSLISGYFEEDGVTRSMIPLVKLPNGEWFPANNASFEVNGKSYCYPEDLKSAEDFITRWNSSWAKSLVYYHPEYCYYRWCIRNLNSTSVPHGETSAEFDDRLAGISTWNDAIAAFPQLLLPGTLVDADPYFNHSPDGMAQKTAMQTKISQYETIGGTTYSMMQIAAIANRCPGFHGTNLAPGCDAFGTPASTEIMDAEWNTYKSLYLSYKNQLMGQAADDWSAGESCARGYNGCIGNGDFTPFGTVLISGATNLFDAVNNQPCSKPTFRLYKEKVRRFDFSGSALKKKDYEKSAYNRFYHEKACPLDLDFAALMNEISGKGQLTNLHDLHTNKFFTLNILSAIQVAPPPNPADIYREWDWNPANAGVDLTVTFVSPSLGPSPRDIKMTITGGQNWTTNPPTNFRNFVSKGFNSSTGKYHFEMDATAGAVTVKIKGETLIPFGSCTFDDYCTNTDYANDLSILMGELASNGVLTSTVPVNLETGYAGFLTRYVRSNVGGTNNNLRWVYNGTGSFRLYQHGAAPGANDIVINFNAYNPPTFAHAILNQVKQVKAFKHSKTDLNTAFSATLLYSPTGLPPYNQVEVTGTASRGRLGDCTDPVRDVCDNNEYKATSDFERLLYQMVTIHPTADLSLMDKSYYTYRLESYVGKGVATLKAPVWGTDEITTEIELRSGDLSTVLNRCKIRLYRKNDLISTAFGPLSGITDIGMIETEKGRSQGVNHDFTVIVKHPGNISEKIFGTVSCIPIEDCPDCIPPLEVSVAGECPNYQYYVTQVQNFNQISGLPPVTIDPNDPNFPCECVENYIHYLKGWRLSFPLVFNHPPCDTPSTPTPVSLTQFSVQFGCKMSFCYECDLRHPASHVRNVLQQAFMAFNNKFSGMTPPPAWYTGRPPVNGGDFFNDSISPYECECAMKYAVYLNRWVNNLNTEYPFTDYPDFAPLYFSEFKRNGCQGNECWLQYRHYVQKSMAAGTPQANIAPYNNLVDCSCWLRFADRYPNLAAHKAADVTNYCKSSGLTYPPPYSDINFSDPIKKRIKTFNAAQNLTRIPDQCETPVMPVEELVNPCADYLDMVAVNNAKNRYEARLNELKTAFQMAYYEKCLEATESFTLQYPSRDYHYTLYYYDQAGNLVKTVPPAGVRPVTDQADFDLINTDRTFGTRKFYTRHILSTVYEYNSLNQLLRQSVPDHDKMNRWEVTGTQGVPAGFSATDLHFSSGTNGVMIGEAAGITYMLRTTDGGKSWLREGDIYTGDINRIAMLDNTVGYAVGNNGLLLKTTDGGTNWVILPQNGAVTEHLVDIVVRSSGGNHQGYVAGGNGFFRYFTDNAGTISWSSSMLPPAISTADVTSISFKETATGTGYATASLAGATYLIKCSNWAGPWSVVSIPGTLRTSDLAAACMIDATTGYVAGADGLLLKTQDGGQSWTLVATQTTLNFEKIFFPSGLTGKGLAIASGQLWSTIDDGATWQQASAIGNVRNFYFYNKSDGNGYAAGDDGYISVVRWISGKLSVNRIKPPQNVTDDLTSLHFIDANNGLVAGANGSLYRVINASTGWEWYPVTHGLSAGDFTDVYMHSASVGAAIFAGQVYRLNISGAAPSYTATTTNISAAGATQYTSLHENAGNLYALDTDASPQVTTYAASLPATPTSLAISALSGDGAYKAAVGFGSSSVIVVGASGGIRRYQAGWNSALLSVSPGRLNTVHAVAGTNEVWLAGADGNLFSSTNNAAGFVMHKTGVSFTLTRVSMSSAGEGFAIGNSASVLHVSAGVPAVKNTGLSLPVLDVLATATNTASFVSATPNRGLIKTNNGGSGFTGVDPGGMNMAGTWFTNVAKTPSGELLLGGKQGTLCRINTSGIWSKAWASPPALYDVHLNAGVGLAGGKLGVTLRTADNGNSWYYNGQTPVSGTAYADINAVWVVNANLAYVAGNRHNTAGYLAKSMKTDGTNATNLAFGSLPLSTTHFKAIAFNEFGDGLLTGGTQVYRLASGSSTWTQVLNVAGASFNTADAQENYALVAGDNGHIYRSSSLRSSATFAAVTPPSGYTAANFSHVYMYDRSRAYLTANNGGLLKTVDWGISWQAKNADLTGNTTNNLTVLALNSRDHIVFAGSNGYCRQATDQADFASTMFWYDRLGRMVVSQNTRQFNKTPDKAYSYTLYDELGRITEVGEKASASPIETTYSGRQMDDALLATWISTGGSSTRTEVTMTFYDNQQAPVSVITQYNMKKRVAAVYYMDVHTTLAAGATSGFEHAAYYTYDVHGNVDHMVQDIPALAAVNNRYKHLHYQYDLISGKVNQVDYNPGMADEYHHRYTYDADNRIVEVETSRDGVLWDKDANYAYYRHGPLARTEIGDLKVQGLDYMYTIQGWIKGVNSNTMNYSRDPGRDGDIALAGNSHAAVGRDAFGYTLGYFQGDYSDIATLAQTDRFEAAISGSDLLAARQDLWNGNISHMVTCLPKAANYSASHTITPEAFGSAYTYDQLNRLRSSRVFTNISPTLNQWQAGGGTNPQAFATDYTYDAMGNILTQKRNGAGVAGAPQALDDLTYVYDWKYQNMNIPAEKRDLVSNRLYHVWDQVSSGNYTDDIDHQGGIGTGAGQLDTSTLQTFLATANYGYDELGNLTRDRQEEIAGIEWTVYGKIKKVTRTAGSSKADLEFGYDAGGNRLWKKVTPKGAGAVVKTFYYLRDAQGVEMARYVSYTNTASQLMLVSEEHAIYGSSRLGIDNRKDTLYMAGVYNPSWGGASTVRRELGNKSYELSNHLGNVLVTVTDKKVYKVASGTLYYEAEITTINDYYPFGSDIKTRGYSSVNYRYSFNGKEKDDEAFEGCLAFEARIFDGRLGKFLSLDPRMGEYAWQTPYAYFKNCPVSVLDIAGMGGPYQEDGVNMYNSVFTDLANSDVVEYAEGTSITRSDLTEPAPKHGTTKKSDDGKVLYYDEYQKNEDGSSGGWTDKKPQSFSAERIEALKVYADANELTELDDCITTFNNGQKILHNDPSLVLSSQIISGGGIIGSGRMLYEKGLAQKVKIFNADVDPVSGVAQLSNTIEDELLKIAPPNPGNYIFAVGIGWGFHTATIVLERRSATEFTFYSIDQMAGFANRSVPTGDDFGLQAFLNEYTHDAHMAYTGKKHKSALEKHSPIDLAIWLVVPDYR